MEIAAFAEMTYRVLEETPLSEFIPTMCLPEQDKVLALSGIPEKDEDNFRNITLEWAKAATNPNEEFLIAFRDGEGYFRIMRRADGKLTEALYPERKNS